MDLAEAGLVFAVPVDGAGQCGPTVPAQVCRPLVVQDGVSGEKGQLGGSVGGAGPSCLSWTLRSPRSPGSILVSQAVCSVDGFLPWYPRRHIYWGRPWLHHVRDELADVSLSPLALCPVHLNSSPGLFLCFLSTKACTVPRVRSHLCKSLRCLHRQRASPKHLECAFCPWRGLLLVSLVLPPGEEARGHTAPAEARVALERAPHPHPRPEW